MNWNTLTSPEALAQLDELSNTQPVLIFKHSTRCSISATALSRLERQWDSSKTSLQPYFLDLLSYRSLSDFIAEKYQVEHQSPQVLVIHKGQCVYNASHMAINFAELATKAVA